MRQPKYGASGECCVGCLPGTKLLGLSIFLTGMPTQLQGSISFPGVMQSKCKADHSTTASTGVKNGWRCPSTTPFSLLCDLSSPPYFQRVFSYGNDSKGRQSDLAVRPSDMRTEWAGYRRQGWTAHSDRAHGTAWPVVIPAAGRWGVISNTWSLNTEDVSSGYPRSFSLPEWRMKWTNDKGNTIAHVICLKV